MRFLFFVILVFCVVLCSGVPLFAGQTLVIGVEDKDWGGHYRWEGDELVGIDADIVRIAAKELGYRVKFVPYPWKRVLKMAEIKQIDGVLDLAPTKARKRYLYYVSTPITEETSVLWQKSGAKLEFDGQFSTSLRLGLMRGSDWSNRFHEMGKPTVVRFDSYEAAFRTLVEGRIDFFAGYLAPTREHIVKLGVLDEVEPHPYKFERLPYYLALSNKPGYEELANRLSDALQAFFYGPEYQKLLDAYGIVSTNHIFYPSRQ